MAEELSAARVKYAIKQYLNMDRAIRLCEIEKANISARFYTERSMVGVACTDSDSVEQFQHTMNPEAGALIILAEEETVQKRIDRLKEKRKRAKVIGLFKHKEALIQSQKKTYLTDYELQAYETIGSLRQAMCDEKLDGLRDEVDEDAETILELISKPVDGDSSTDAIQAYIDSVMDQAADMN